MTALGRAGACALVVATVTGCHASRNAKAPSPAIAPLHLHPLTDLAPAAGISWLVDARPHDLWAHANLRPAIEQVIPASRFRAFAADNGGIDLRDTIEFAVASYGASTLWLVQTPLDPARVEAAFAARVGHLDGQSQDHATADPNANVVRMWGTAGSERAQIAIFGSEAIGLEVGRFGPLRVAELFALERLKRASPALHAEPLERASQLLGDAPARAFALGPFEGERANGLGGLLRATTALAASVHVIDGLGSGSGAERPGLAFTLVLLGAWGQDAPAAAERLDAAFGVVQQSAIGHLLGLDHPIAPARVRASAEALALEITLDAGALARGLHDATGATVDEMMGGTGSEPPHESVHVN